jgi:hypothetical protein
VLSVGPILIFDKSALQSLSVDESVWLDQFFLANITPLFYVETLADLEKEVQKGNTPEGVVGLIAAKAPTGAAPNVHHQTLILHELVGGPPLSMDTRPVVSGGTRKRTADGRIAIDFEQFPESAALDRWQAGDFLDLERRAARTWRADLASHDIDRDVTLAANMLPRGRRTPDLSSLKGEIDVLCGSADGHFVHAMLELLDVPATGRPQVHERWLQAGSPDDLCSFAPFATHVLKVTLLYLMGVNRGLISGERASNRVDMAYLFYLPFCMMFTSGDRLHKRTAPLFLTDQQSFLPAEELKRALAEYERHFERYPDEVKAQGVIRFASFPPPSVENAVATSWDRFMRHGWRDVARAHEERVLSPGFAEEELASAREFDELRANAQAVRDDEGSGASLDEADIVVVERRVPVTRGKWSMVPPPVW